MGSDRRETREAHAPGEVVQRVLRNSTFNLAGQGRINPTATLLSAALMLEHLRLGPAAARLDRAISRVYSDGRRLTPDQGGSASTDEFAAAVLAALEVERA